MTLHRKNVPEALQQEAPERQGAVVSLCFDIYIQWHASVDVFLCIFSGPSSRVLPFSLQVLLKHQPVRFTTPATVKIQCCLYTLLLFELYLWARFPHTDYYQQQITKDFQWKITVYSAIQLIQFSAPTVRTFGITSRGETVFSLLKTTKRLTFKCL